MKTILKDNNFGECLAVDAIVTCVAPDMLFLFSNCNVQQNPGTHHYFLVLTDNPILPEQVQKLGDTVTILTYRTSRISRIKGNHRNFLYNVFTHGELLYKKDGFEIPKIVAVPTDHAAKVAYWAYCTEVARDCLTAEKAARSPLVSAMLLKQAAEMVSLGLIYMHLDCRPGNIGLRHLLNLCVLFMPKVAEIFPADSIVLRVLLSSNPEKLHYRSSGPPENELRPTRIAAMNFMELGYQIAERAKDLQSPQSIIG